MLLLRKKLSETALFSYHNLNCYTCVCSYYQVIQVNTFVVEVLYQMFRGFYKFCMIFTQDKLFSNTD